MGEGVNMQSDEVGQLVAALCQVMRSVGYVRATGRNDAQRYSFTSDEDLAASVQPALVACGVVVVPISVRVAESQITTTRGAVLQRVIVEQTWRVAHTSGEFMTLEICGEGCDSMDKATPKALTACRKYLLRQLLCVPTGDDAEVAAAVAAAHAPAVTHSPLVAGLLQRLDEMAREGVPHTQRARAKIEQVAPSGDDDVRDLCGSVIDWINSQAE